MVDEIQDVIPEEGNDEGEDPSDKGGEGTQDVTPVKIGDKEYTPEQLTGYITKASDYDKLLPEFTKKSQALALLLGGKKPDESQEDLPSFLKKGWKPKTYEELGTALKEAVEWGEERSQKATETKTQEAKDAKEQVDTFVAEILKTNKEFDQKEFFQYIERHKSKVKTLDDLKSEYSKYSEANADGKMAERRALLGKVKRGKDSVSTPSSEDKPSFDATEIRVKSRGMVEAAKEAFSKIK